MDYVITALGLPTTLAAIRLAHPGISIPAGADLSDLGYAPLVDDPPVAPDGHRAVRGAPSMVDGVWRYTYTIEPMPQVVASCSPWQIRKALNELGLRDAVELAVSQSGDRTIQDGWEFATEFRADDSFVLDMGAAIGKSHEEVADLILYASTL